MSIKDWAEREVEIACERERGNSSDESEWDYGCACYESALKAYKSLMEDEHSGFSFGVTKQILVRLMDGKPLTPIEDTDDIWEKAFDGRGSKGHYVAHQCKRMSSLFKIVYDDGTINYSDNDRCICLDADDPNTIYSSGLVKDVIDEMFPITMPYYPGGRLKVFCTEFLSDPKNGDFDTVAILHAIKPNGERIDINRAFKESDDGWVEITIEEYFERIATSIKNKSKEKE